MFADVVLPSADPGGLPDPERFGEWHKEVVALLLEFGMQSAGLLRESHPAWWSEERCPRCDCGSPRGGPCWYCNEEAAAT